MTVKVTKWIEEHVRGKKFFPEEGVWKSQIGPEHEVPFNSTIGRKAKTYRAKTWVECEPPRKVLYKDADKEGIKGGTVTTEYEVDAGKRVQLDAEELKTVIMALMSTRRHSDPKLMNGGDPREYLRLSLLLGKLGVKAEDMD